MKQKYVISIKQETKKLTIQEYAELEKGEIAFVCEEVHNVDDFRNAMEDGAKALVPVIRRPNMYPRQDFGEKIAQGIIDLLNDVSGATSSEILINDHDDFIEAEDDIDPKVVYEDDGDEAEGDKGDGDGEKPNKDENAGKKDDSNDKK